MARPIQDHDHKPPPPPSRSTPSHDDAPAYRRPEHREHREPAPIAESTWADHPKHYPPPVEGAREVPAVEPRSEDTTGLHDMKALGQAIVALCHTAEFDDMTCGEIEQGIAYASHLIKLEFQEHGTLDPSP